jgi:hypothetical protein
MQPEHPIPHTCWIMETLLYPDLNIKCSISSLESIHITGNNNCYNSTKALEYGSFLHLKNFCWSIFSYRSEHVRIFSILAFLAPHIFNIRLPTPYLSI